MYKTYRHNSLSLILEEIFEGELYQQVYNSHNLEYMTCITEELINSNKRNCTKGKAVLTIRWDSRLLILRHTLPIYRKLRKEDVKTEHWGILKENDIYCTFRTYLKMFGIRRNILKHTLQVERKGGLMAFCVGAICREITAPVRPVCNSDECFVSSPHLLWSCSE